MIFNITEADMWLDKSNPFFLIALGYSLIWWFVTLCFLHSSPYYKAESKWRMIRVLGALLLNYAWFRMIPSIRPDATWPELKGDRAGFAVIVSDQWLWIVGMLGILLLVYLFRRLHFFDADIWSKLSMKPLFAVVIQALFPGCLYPFKGYFWLGFFVTFFMIFLFPGNLEFAVILYFIDVFFYLILPMKIDKAMTAGSEKAEGL